VRKTARALVVDAAGRLLLLRVRDPARPAADPWWEVPGGGLKPGEDAAATVVREVAEETGLAIRRDQVGPPLWHRETTFSWCGRSYHQRETLHVVRLDTAEVPAGQSRPTVAEQDAFLGMRWWTVDDLVTSGDRFFPGALPAAAPAMLAGHTVDEPYEDWQPTIRG
jgi:8-oxo-dGTP pyrophosphatase MutT (NUDIX family)